MWRDLSAASRCILERRPWAIAALAAAAAVSFSWGYLDRREKEILAVAAPVLVVVAARDVAAGETLGGETLRLEAIPRRYVQPAAFRSLESAIGRIAMVPLRAAMQLTAAVARRPSEVQGVAAQIPAGRRAYVVGVDEERALLIRPNDAVDVLATFDLGNEASVRRTTVTLVENAQVLSVGGEVADAVSSPASRAPGGGLFGSTAASVFPTRGPRAVALAVTREEAQALAFAEVSGRVDLALCPFGDDGEEARARPTTIATITGGHDELAPMKRGFREYRGR